MSLGRVLHFSTCEIAVTLTKQDHLEDFIIFNMKF